MAKLLRRLRIDAVFHAVFLERLGQRRRRRDRIPRANGRTAVDAAQRGGDVAVDEDFVADVVRAAHAQADRRYMLLRVVTSEVQSLYVRVEQLFLALVLLGEQLFDFLRVDVEQHR
jgi:hypothetical protein